MADVTRAPFGATPAGDAVDIFTLTNPHGLEVRAASYGGIIVSLLVPDRDGRRSDLVLGHDSLEEYLRDSSYFGAIVGRYANRIADARFTVDGQTYRLAANDGRNHLHGGRTGFARVVWRAAPFRTDHAAGVALSNSSPDGEEGYPGNLEARVTYTLTDRNELMVDSSATTDKTTPVNLTQHTYFNLAGDGAGDVLGHLLRIDADLMTPVDEHLIPTGALAPVAGGPFDFRSLTRIGARITTDDEQLHRGRGYDHNFVLNRTGAGLVHAAEVVEPTSGRTLDVHTTEPGLQLYSGNHLDGSVSGKAGRVYGRRAGLCLETQHYPDSPNQPGFPSTLLRPGAQYRSRTVFAFGTTS
ncbi:MAG TPA: aldose epimerase family protein [Gemmatimonadales bacterium]|nr:aldose epimerase family protein [Gemmatimonadales bacterium]